MKAKLGFWYHLSPKSQAGQLNHWDGQSLPVIFWWVSTDVKETSFVKMESIFPLGKKKRLIGWAITNRRLLSIELILTFSQETETVTSNEIQAMNWHWENSLIMSVINMQLKAIIKCFGIGAL